jgi:hypothetical protein
MEHVREVEIRENLAVEIDGRADPSAKRWPVALRLKLAEDHTYVVLLTEQERQNLIAALA